MVDEQLILAAERLRDDLTEFRSALRQRYRGESAQVTSDELRERAAHLGETWLVELTAGRDVAVAIGSETIADLNVHFQRLLTYAEHATTRAKYDAELKSILNAFTLTVVVPLKKSRGKPSGSAEEAPPITPASAFVGQSFAVADEKVNKLVHDVLESIAIKPFTGEKPKADLISEKVRRLIDEQPLFVGIFTRRDKIARKNEWTTSAWVIDEKAYAHGRQKRLILLKERGVGSIGGIQGDYEYIEFARDSLEILVLKILQIFDLKNGGLRK